MFPLSDIESDNGIESVVVELVRCVVREVCHMSEMNEFHQKIQFRKWRRRIFHPVGDKNGVQLIDGDRKNMKTCQNEKDEK